MPVVISLLNAFTGLSAAATGIALDNTALIVAGMIVGASGSILTNLMATAMNRSIPSIVAGGFGGGGGGRGRRGRRRARGHGALDERRRRRDPARLRQPRGDRPRLRHGRRPGPARGARADQGARGTPGRGQLRDPPGRRAHAGAHERAAGRGRRAVRPAQGDGRRQPRVPAHRRLAGDRRQRRDQPGRQEHAVLADLRHADPRGRRQPLGDRDQALDEPRLRRHRERALLRPEDRDAVRRRQVGGERDHRRARPDL